MTENGICSAAFCESAALGLDLETVKEAFKPYATEIVKVTTAEDFS